MSWYEPTGCTKIPPRSVTLTDTTFPIDWKVLPAILSLRDISWENLNRVPCSMRSSLEKAGYLVEPPLPGEGKLLL